MPDKDLMCASAIAERLAGSLELAENCDFLDVAGFEDSSEGTALVVKALRNMAKIFHEMATTSDV